MFHMRSDGRRVEPVKPQFKKNPKALKQVKVLPLTDLADFFGVFLILKSMNDLKTVYIRGCKNVFYCLTQPDKWLKGTRTTLKSV